ncbi:MAG TPA: squalene synthase HpnC [Solirubrobacteraceae bacterium]|nr:squalene synthase HpnC [Solirubrobacteraceae bacterium]
MSTLPRTLTAEDLPGGEALLAQAASENFTVANRLLGADTCRHLMAIYGYARLVDDVGDEAEGDRGALLDVVEDELAAVFAGGEPRHPVMRSLGSTVRACGLPEEPFRRLLAANRMDQEVSDYDTWDRLMEYCALSANPVGELVLHVFGAATPDRIALSDRICSGLQIVEHLQDIAEDHARGRIYLPAEDRCRFGVDERSLAGADGPGGPDGPLRALIGFEAARARRLLSAGAPLARTLPPRERIAVAGFVAGGRAALDGLPAPRSPAGATDDVDAAGAFRATSIRPRAHRWAFVTAFPRAVLGR